MGENNCFFCSDAVDLLNDDVFVEETTWVSKKGIVTIGTGRVAHGPCMRGEKKEIPGQTAIIP